ncbi:unnamed protein product [Brassica rapa subsp. trilocularis]
MLLLSTFLRGQPRLTGGERKRPNLLRINAVSLRPASDVTVWGVTFVCMCISVCISFH